MYLERIKRIYPSDYPANLRWTVSDVSAVMARGAEIARERDPAERLRFNGDFAGAGGVDVLLTLGARRAMAIIISSRVKPHEIRASEAEGRDTRMRPL